MLPEPMVSPRRRGTFLFVIWYSGGGTQPMFGTARLLAARGHRVRILAPEQHRSRVEAAGGSWLPFPAECEFDPSRGRALEDQADTFVVPLLWGLPLAEALLEAVPSVEPDVIVVDQQLRTTLSAAQATGSSVVVFAHTAHRFHGAYDPGWAAEDLRMTNDTRALMGLEPLVADGVRVGIELMRRSRLVLVPMPYEFDPWEDDVARVVHAGPLFEEDDALDRGDPWPPDHPDPLVVVSLSSQYMHQEEPLRRIVAALDGLRVRILVTTGLELEAAELGLPSHVLTRAYVPHRALFAHADLVVTHGGVGTIMAAFDAGAPLVCLPLGRDQPGNAARVAELGAGIALDGAAAVAAIRAAAAEALASPDLRAGAKRMKEIVASYGSGVRAVSALEPLATMGRRSIPPAVRR
jgi:MGT family glycosyltransferase